MIIGLFRAWDPNCVQVYLSLLTKTPSQFHLLQLDVVGINAVTESLCWERSLGSWSPTMGTTNPCPQMPHPPSF